MNRAALYRTIWRWHFYAGLVVIPFILLLSVTGAAYLFKPQVERWEEAPFRSAQVSRVVLPGAQVEAALAAFPGARFVSYRLPERAGDAALVHLALPDGQAMRDVFVAPDGRVRGSLDPEARLMELDKRIHGQLLIGKRGSWLVELAASWGIVMILTGLYLWWPKGTGLAGMLWPRLGRGKRVFWRDLHAVTGFWVSGLALVLLVTGLPWAGLWGSAFKAVRAELGWVKAEQDWTLGGEPAHAGHDHDAMMQGHHGHSGAASLDGLDAMVLNAQAEGIVFPAVVTPPGAPGRFGKAGATVWTVRSDAGNRPARMTLTYDPVTRRELSREGFADGHVVDRIVGYGIAWHEGQLFGWINQLIGVLTAIALVTLAVSGFVLWRRRKPAEGLGAPPVPAVPARIGGVVAILLGLAVLLPLLAASLVVLWLIERLVLPRMPKVARWLGVPASV